MQAERILSKDQGEILDLIACAAIQQGMLPARMTFEQFIDWCTNETLAEWVDGEVINMTAPSKAHRDIAGFLFKVVGLFVEQRALGQVVGAPFKMKLSTRPSGRQPDLVFVTTAHLDRFAESYLDGPADLAVEVTSPGTLGVDRGDKFYEYEAAGISEYRLIDADRQRAEFYQLDEHGDYQLMHSGKEGVYRSKMLPGFALRLEWLWQRPPVMDVLHSLEVL